MKTNHGGKRPNAGRRSKYNEPTKYKGYNVPLSKIDQFDIYVKGLLAKWETK